MKPGEKTREIQRYIALDIHKEYVLAGGMNAGQEWILQPRKIEMGKFREWSAANLCAGDAVALETTTNVWDIYDVVAPHVTRAMAAQSVKRADCVFGSFYRRLRGRLDKAQATVATAHMIARVVYRMLKYKVEYETINIEEYEAKYKEQQIKYMKKKAAKLGFQLVPA